jgi:hypothetical protein
MAGGIRLTFIGSVFYGEVSGHKPSPSLEHLQNIPLSPLAIS